MCFSQELHWKRKPPAVLLHSVQSVAVLRAVLLRGHVDALRHILRGQQQGLGNHHSIHACIHTYIHTYIHCRYRTILIITYITITYIIVMYACRYCRNLCLFVCMCVRMWQVLFSLFRVEYCMVRSHLCFFIITTISFVAGSQRIYTVHTTCIHACIDIVHG